MSHDYQPSWDYPVVELGDLNVSTEHAKAIDLAISQAQQDLSLLFGFSDFEVFFVEPGGLTNGHSLHDAVAVYCNGTSSRPVIGFDVQTMLDVCNDEGLDFSKEFRTSIAHELAHAYQETLGIEHYDHADEDEAEIFGKRWGYEDQIDLTLLPKSHQENMCEIMFACVQEGRVKSMDAILTAYPAIKDRKTFNGHGALHMAANKGDKEMCELLIQHQLQLNSPSDYWETPLHLASTRGYTEVVELLVTAGAAINAVDGGRRTPLHKAAGAEREMTCRKLIELGANQQAKDSEGFTALSADNTSQQFLERLRSAEAMDAITEAFKCTSGASPKKKSRGLSL